MKQATVELNIFPVYETEEVLILVVPTGTVQVKTDKKGRVILNSHPGVIKLIGHHYHIHTSYTEGHISFFNDCEYVFPKGHSFRIEEVGNDGELVRITVSRKNLVKYDSRLYADDGVWRGLPFEKDYIMQIVDDMPTLYIQ